MALGQILAGNIIYADDIQDELDQLEAYEPVTVTKSTDQSVTNSTTLANDNTLFFTPAINTTWKVCWDLFYSATAAQDGKIALTFPTGATCPWGYQGYESGGTFSGIAFDTTVASGTSFAIAGTGAGNSLVCRIVATVTMSTTAGNVRLQFAQNSALAATSMTVRAGSTMTYQRIA